MSYRPDEAVPVVPQLAPTVPRTRRPVPGPRAKASTCPTVGASPPPSSSSTKPKPEGRPQAAGPPATAAASLPTQPGERVCRRGDTWPAVPQRYWRCAAQPSGAATRAGEGFVGGGGCRVQGDDLERGEAVPCRAAVRADNRGRLRQQTQRLGQRDQRPGTRRPSPAGDQRPGRTR